MTGVTSYVHGALLGLALATGTDRNPTVAATLHGVADEHYERAGRAFAAIEAELRARDHTGRPARLGPARPPRPPRASSPSPPGQAGHQA